MAQSLESISYPSLGTAPSTGASITSGRRSAMVHLDKFLSTDADYKVTKSNRNLLVASDITIAFFGKIAGYLGSYPSFLRWCW
jgi:hypothetical protein